MRIRPTILEGTISLAAVCFLLFCMAATGSAQSIVQAGTFSTASCTKTLDAPGAVKRCWLEMKTNRLIRDGEIVGRTILFHSIGLSDYVVGDSATHYARIYENDQRWAGRTATVGTALWFSSFVAGRLCPTKTCTKQPNKHAILAGEIAGASLFAISIPMDHHARSVGHKAIAFYNDSLRKVAH